MASSIRSPSLFGNYIRPNAAAEENTLETSLLNRVNSCGSRHELQMLGELFSNERLWEIIELSKTSDKISQAAANAISALCVVGELFSGRDLRSAKFPGADLRGAIMDQTLISGTKDSPTDMRRVRLDRAYLRGMDFDHVRTEGIFLGTPQYLVGHKSKIPTLLYCQQTKELITGSYDNTVRIWNSQTEECLQIIKLPEYQADDHGIHWNFKDLSISEDGKTLVIVLNQGEIQVWKRGQSRELFSLNQKIQMENQEVAHQDYQRDREYGEDSAPDDNVALSKSGRFLVWAEKKSRSVVVYSINEKKILNKKATDKPVYGLVFVNDHTLLLGCSENNIRGYKRASSVNSWNFIDNSELKNCLNRNGHIGSIQCMQMLDDGYLLLGLHLGWDADSGSIEKWEVDIAKMRSESATLATNHESLQVPPFRQVTVSPDAKYTAILEKDGKTIQVFDSKKRIWSRTSVPSGKRADTLVFTDDPKEFSVAISPRVTLLPINPISARSGGRDSDTDSIHSVHYLPSSQQIVTVEPTGAKLRDMQGQFLRTISSAAKITQMNVVDDPTNPLFIYESANGFLTILDLTGTVSFTEFTNPNQAMESTPCYVTARKGEAFLVDSSGRVKRLALEGGKLDFHDKKKVNINGDISGHQIRSLCISPNGKFLLAKTSDLFSFYCFKEKKFIQVAKAKGTFSSPYCIDDQMACITNGEEITVVRLSDLPTEESTKALEATYQTKATFPLTSICRDQKQPVIAAGGDNGEIALWDTDKKELVYRFKAHSGTVQALQFIHNDKSWFLLSGSDDKSLRFWKIDTSGDRLRTLLQWTTSPRLTVHECQNVPEIFQ